MRPGAKVLGVAGPTNGSKSPSKCGGSRRCRGQVAAGETLSLKELEEQYGADPADMEKVATV